MNTLLFTLLLTTAVPDDLSVEQFLEMLENTSESFNNLELVYENEGVMLPEFETKEELEDFVNAVSKNRGYLGNESLTEIADTGISSSGKKRVVTKDYDTYRLESMSPRTDNILSIFVMDDDMEYLYYQTSRHANFDTASYRNRSTVHFFRHERFLEGNTDTLKIDQNKVTLLNDEGEVRNTMEFDIIDQMIVPIRYSHFSGRGKADYYYKDFDTINGLYLPKTVETRQNIYREYEFLPPHLGFKKLTKLERLDNIDEANFDIMLPPGTPVDDRRTRPRTHHKIEDGEEDISLVEFVKNLDEGGK